MSDKSKCSLTNAELVAKAREWITSLCHTGGRSWTMRVPVEPDRDPDMIFEELCIRLERGCPCHEPEPVVKESLTAQPDPNGSIRPESDETAPVRVHDKP